MKKIISLVLALSLVLTAVSAFAGGSPTTETKTSTTTTTTTDTTSTTTTKTAAAMSFDIIENNDQTKALIDAFAAAKEAGDILSVLPEDVRAQVPADMTNINEIVTVLLSGIADGVVSATVGYIFNTKYEAGEKVCLAFAVSATEWVLKEGVAQSDGSVNVTLDRALIDKILNKPITLVVISK